MSPTVSGRHVFLYDQDCGFCTAFARRLERHARTPVEVLPLQQAADDPQLRGDLSDEAWRASAHYIDAGGQRHSGGASVTKALRLLPGGFVAGILDLPLLSRLRDRGYVVVANNRHVVSRLLRLDRCVVPPSPEDHEPR
jgi:predicted DCC family thiol-disulfide oxidoreductase YuxK